MFDIQTFFVHVYENILQFLLIYFLLSQYKSTKPRVSKEKFILILSVLLIIQAFFNSFEEFTINVIVSTIIQIIISSLFFSKWKDVFLSSIIAIAVIDIGEGIAAMLLLGTSYSGQDLDQFMLKPLNTVLVLTIARLISLVLLLIILRFRKVKGGNSELPVIYWLTFLFITMKDILWILILLDSQVEISFYYWAAVIPILPISYILFYYTRKAIENMVRTQVKSKLLDEKNKYYEQQLVAMKQTLELQKTVRHDLKNKLSPLVYLAENGKTAELVKQVQELGSLNVLGKIYAESGNVTIDYIINQNLQVLASKGVKISCEINVPNDIDIVPFDLSTILGNLIDNSAEALDHVKDEKWIVLKVSYQVGFLIIHVTNSFDGTVRLDNNKIISRKKDTKNHGLGLNSITTTAEEYSGEVTIKYDEKKFDVIVKLLV
ncbi:sensor histidine kinase [Listeria seeligeri]|uniref:sensor histidine kinase n=1 Tax=Listeria seeligeri TaxID=1640 RepID=UPI00188944CB|nr:GHKL domain-containing protein [Listeria seeligeri]MBF2397066.1 GHKL domain-containing protein [Listeria seeligeri]MBF2454409.1 GHKL domain-containing protein [Listeria seeligeri]MBF2670122.1 GHKL domain-containing protein [Listeria seeligeri]